jgi:hypothetical protein
MASVPTAYRALGSYLEVEEQRSYRKRGFLKNQKVLTSRDAEHARI